jgi:glutaminyl-peptide cyclotransferase
MMAGLALLICACQQTAKNNEDSSKEDSGATGITAPAFNADSAYAYTQKQVGFGPRIPNTPAQKQCADWLIQTLRASADTVYVQETSVTAPGKKIVPCINIIGVFNPAAAQRVLLLSHWDTRPFADKDAFDKTKKFDGADDGGSGTAVLLELARQLKAQRPDIGVDILLTDVEDSGNDEEDDSYCLGTQYWAQHPHKPGYKANYGILLDMVGGRGAQFYMEALSQQYAYAPMSAFWNTANRLGYSDYFHYEQGMGVTDDHVYVNKLANIPTFDIIATQANHTFAPHHHTQNDNMSVIDVRTLKAVGQTLMQVIYVQPF